MRRRIPSTAMLLAFEAAATCLSFTRAGRKLHLTQSAISHQIQSLEETMGVELFERSRQGLRLTPAGELLLGRLGPALNALEAAILETATGQGTRALHVAVVPTFASKWLIPRLPDFSSQHPEVQVNLSTRLTRFDFSENRFDAAVYFGSPDWPQASCDWLFADETVVVCSPSLARGALQSPQDLSKVTLLHQSTRSYAWRSWTEAAALSEIDTDRGPVFELFSMVTEAAAAGLGAAVLPRFLVEDELASGKLVSPFGPSVRSPQAYYLACPEARAGEPAVRAFREWLLLQAREGAAAPCGTNGLADGATRERAVAPELRSADARARAGAPGGDGATRGRQAAERRKRTSDRDGQEP